MCLFWLFVPMHDAFATMVPELQPSSTILCNIRREQSAAALGPQFQTFRSPRAFASQSHPSCAVLISMAPVDDVQESRLRWLHERISEWIRVCAGVALADMSKIQIELVRCRHTSHC